MILGLTGRKRSGKNTAADALVGPDWNYRPIAFADALRTMIYTLDPYVPSVPTVGKYDNNWKRYSQVLAEVGYEQAKENPEIRRLLQCFGTEVMRGHLSDDLWVDIVEKALVDADAPDWVVTDVRFDNEAAMIRRHGGIVLSISRPYSDDAPLDKHVSEAGVSRELVDAYIINDSTVEHLHQIVQRIVFGHIVHPRAGA